MTTLLLLNGVPGVGKSTLARLYVADHPLALALDVDVVRHLLGAWTDHPAEAGLAARRLALVMAREHLTAGHDVVVPQYLARPDFPDALAALAGDLGTRFVHVALTAPRARALQQYRSRPPSPEREPLDDSAFAAMADRLARFLAQRPEAVTVPVPAGETDAGYRALLTALRARDSASG